MIAYPHVPRAWTPAGRVSGVFTLEPDGVAFPFSAVVGSEDLALALILTTVSPEVGGVLVRGEKGTAKTTMVRALAHVLPAVTVVEGCRFSCDPADPDPTCPDGPHDAAESSARPARLVELPVGATEDRVIGRLDLQQALGAGQVTYEPGLLAAAHRGILYVDEVNLLHDHLVDLLLDAAAMGRSTVEREGVSVSHASQMVLIGTMNPEEGELRPQLLDRFGLTVEIAAPRDPPLRAEVVRRRMAFDHDPEAFLAGVRRRRGRAPAADRHRARACSPSVRLSDDQLITIAEVCAAFEVDGMRADIVDRPGRRRPRGLARPTDVDHRPTSGPPPGWPCRTDAAATRSTPRAWTRSCSTSCSTRTSRSRRRSQPSCRPSPARHPSPADAGRTRPRRRRSQPQLTRPSGAEPRRPNAAPRPAREQRRLRRRRLPDPAVHRGRGRARARRAGAAGR